MYIEKQKAEKWYIQFMDKILSLKWPKFKKNDGMELPGNIHNMHIVS